MNFGLLVQSVGLYLATIIVGVSSALIPFVNIEAYLLFLGYLIKDNRLVFFLLLATLFHMVGKVILYSVGRGTLKLNVFDLENRVERAKKRYKFLKVGSLWTLWLSALVGLPPFYVVTILAGTLKIKLWQFVSIGFLGRLLRFSIILFLPKLIMEIAK